jgi:hypothetical protein
MKCRVKHGISTGTGKKKVTIPKGQEGFIKSVMSGELKRLFPELDFKTDGCFYLVDFPEAKDLIIPTRDVEIV